MLRRPGVDAAGDVGHLGEAVLGQEGGHALAARAVVAQAGDALAGSSSARRAGISFIGIATSVKPCGATLAVCSSQGSRTSSTTGAALGVAGEPVGEFGRADLVDHDVERAQKLKREGSGKFSRRGATVSQGCGGVPLAFARCG